MVTVPAAGPNSSAVLMKNVSSTAMFAETDLKWTRKQPASIVTAVMASQPIGRAVWAASNAAWASTTAPPATTTWRYRRSARDDEAEAGCPASACMSVLLRARIGHRIAPQNRRAVVGRGVAPENRLPVRVVNRVAPQNGGAVGPVADLAILQPLRRNRRQRVQEADEVQIAVV